MVLCFIFRSTLHLGKLSGSSVAGVAPAVKSLEHTAGLTFHSSSPPKSTKQVYIPRTQPTDNPVPQNLSNPSLTNTRDETIATLTSASPMSLQAYLSSCDTKSQREECDAVAFVPTSNSCVLGQRTYAAGLGHQMFEVLMWLRYAQLENSSHIFESFGPIISSEHGDSYEWVNSFFGLVHAVQGMRSIVVDDVNSKLPTTQRCNDVKRPNWLRCGATVSSDAYIHGLSCFESLQMTKLLASYSPCLRQSALCFGDWVKQARALPFNSTVVNIAWHIRVGDKALYEASSMYFRWILCCTSRFGRHTALVIYCTSNIQHHTSHVTHHTSHLTFQNSHLTPHEREVLGYMVPFLRERRSKHFLIGGRGWDNLSPQYVFRFESMFAELGLTSTCQVAAAFLTVQESLLYMMAADVVVSTSSSFTDIVALVSAFPVMINPPPKHGFSSNSIEYTDLSPYCSFVIYSMQILS